MTTIDSHNSKDANLAAAQAFGEAVNSGNFDAFDDVVAADAVDRDPAPEQGRGPQGYKDFFSTMKTAFPDMKVEVEHLVADDDNVAFAYTLTGTNDGPFQGHEPTGKSIQVRGMQIGRFGRRQDGRTLGAAATSSASMTQLGLIQA